MDKRWIVDTDGEKFFVVLKDDKAYIARNGTYRDYRSACNHRNRLNEGDHNA